MQDSDDHGLELGGPSSDTAQGQTVAPTAIDLFAGAGGATQGLVDAGFRVLGAVEFDPVAATSYRLNHPGVYVWTKDIRRVPAAEVARALRLRPGELTLLKACPPCQGFSSLAEGRIAPNDPRNDLVDHTVRFARALRPRAILLENVPGLGRDWRAPALTEKLSRLGYATRSYLVNAADFGVPQTRKRLIILALRGRRATLPPRLTATDPERPVTVREAFETLDREPRVDDPLNDRRDLPATVMRRIEAIPEEGNRFDLPEELQLDCHKRLDQSGTRAAMGSYARLRWDSPAPTMTTRCTTPACGPFLHPKENRPITLREAATLQTFPLDYQFAGSRGDIERQIGNAVPVLMAAMIGEMLFASLPAPPRGVTRAR